ncbi:MAG TPA: energy transducer TonB [Bryobacteraceae bacterium]|jgi:TonB family protein|nr:energy transducer TonB [Bryobacteraceae bacterium]
MYLNLHLYKPVKRRRRVGPLATSVALHGTAFLVLMNAPEIKLPEPAKSEYKQAIEGREQKLVWYKFKELPEVTPPQTRPESKPVKAEVKAKQQIVASRKDAPKRIQMISTPAPEIADPSPVELPNILAVRMPEMAKTFVTPPDVVKPREATIEIAANAPQLQTQPLDPLKLADTPKIVKRFTPPPRRAAEKITEVVRIDDSPPELSTQTVDPLKLADTPRIVKRFTAPRRLAPEKITEIVHVDEAPQVEASATADPELNFSLRNPTRPFTAPPSNKNATAAKPAFVAGAPDIQTANSRDLALVVAGLNPSNVPMTLPRNSSPAQFSAGPEVRPDGANAAGQGKGLNVPDLYVRGNHETKPDLIAQTFAAPTSDLALRSVARLGEPKPSVETGESNLSGAIKVSSAPDPRFNGRDVYMMAIQMPNLTSYSGSWLMWYADRTAREAGMAPISPPVVHRKVDPKYIAAAAADKVEGKVQLACVIGTDGRVSNVELVRGLDSRLNQSAAEAMAKWEFTPATRHGEPVAVDVLVEIPFRLAPPIPVPYSR